MSILKALACIVLIFIFGSNILCSQDTNYIRAGIIPYQVLSRSSGLYVGYDFNKVQFEFRPTFTYSTGVNQWISNLNRDWFFYKGFNNQVQISFYKYENLKIGALVGYKYWWYTNKFVPTENFALFKKGNINYENKSSSIKGPSFGFEFNWDSSDEYFDKSFFLDLGFCSLKGKSTVHYTEEFPSKKITSTKSYDYSCSQNTITFALGIKFGLRKPVKPK